MSDNPEWWDDDKVVRLYYALGESGWAIDMGDGTYRLANTPLIAWNIEKRLSKEDLDAIREELPEWGDLVRVNKVSDNCWLEVIEKYKE